MKRFIAAVGLLLLLAALGTLLPGCAIDLGCNGPRPFPDHDDRHHDHHFRAAAPDAKP